MKKLIMLLSLVIIFGFTMNTVKAEASSNGQQEGLYMVTPDIPEEITTFANEVAGRAITSFMTGNTNQDISISNYNLLFMGSGFYSFDQTTGEPITDIIYFPIFEGERYVLTLTIVNSNDTLSSFISNYFDVEFQNTPKNTPDNPYALLHDGAKANYLLTNYGQTLFQGIPQNAAATRSAPLSLQTLLQNNEVKDVSQEQLDFNEESLFANVPPILTTINPQGFSINTATTKRSNMSYCLLQQYNEPICWAACLGTAYRYRTGNRAVTAGSICDTFNIPHRPATSEDHGLGGHDPLTIYTRYNQLNVAGAGNSYIYRGLILSPFNVQHNINNMFPVHLHARRTYASETFLHGALVEGYEMRGSKMHLYYWDPAAGKTVFNNENGYSAISDPVELLCAGSIFNWYATTSIQ